MIRQKMTQTLQNMAFRSQMQSCLIGMPPIAGSTKEKIMVKKGVLP
jgi:hypothetical protein